MFIYKKSHHSSKSFEICMAHNNCEDFLLITGENPGFEGKRGADGFAAPLNSANAQLLRRIFPFTAPKPVLSNKRTIGLGDRLGIAAPGQLRAVEKYDAVPVLAQQSVRELKLTRRTFRDVLDAATFAVFREDFRRGYGADGDHLKTDAEVEYALDNGYTMITLDCSEHIFNDANDMSAAEVDAAYAINKELEELYCERTFLADGCGIYFSKEEFRRACLIYRRVIDHVKHIFFNYINSKPVDLEISIDEAMTPTTPAQHYFVASELIRCGIKVATLAPRFCGDFQKGIDYIGDLKQFEAEFKVHAAIARHFGYKLSVHSGSDKFSVFPLIGKLTNGSFHLKTAGTSWLEAMRVVARCAPSFYREIHKYALSKFEEAAKYYHVTTDLSKIPDVYKLPDAKLPDLFDHNDARQLIHITYGLILDAKDCKGMPLFRDRLYGLWRANDEIYASHLDRHITKHLELLYSVMD